jgi:ribosomal protein S6
MKRYEGLFILKASSREEGIKETIDKIGAEISALGGKVETVQKMDKKPFMRVANKRHSSGYYVNFIFEGNPSTLVQLRSRFNLIEDLFRVQFTEAAKAVAAKA